MATTSMLAATAANTIGLRGDVSNSRSATNRADQNAPMTPQSQGDVGGIAWADDGVGYSLVGHAAPEFLRPIANEVRKQARAI